MADAQPLLVFDRYEIVRRIAVGGMGEIFLARQRGIAGFDRPVILKSCPPGLASREDLLKGFLEEARLASRLTHPNVVSIYEVGEWSGVYFIAMEYVHGVTIARLQSEAERRNIGVPFRVSADIIRSAALAIDYAHFGMGPDGKALSIVHRDVSPQNIMVRFDGTTKLLDFGIAKAADVTHHTQTGMFKGKLQYMTPEQALGRKASHRSDQFSLGVVLWELCTGQKLFKGNVAAIIQKVIHERIEKPSDFVPRFPRDLEAIIMKMLAKDPSQRFARCKDVSDAIGEFLGRRAGTAGAETREFVATVFEDAARAPPDLTPSPVNIPGLTGLTPTTGMGCTHCGADNRTNARFCSECGGALSGSSLVPQTPPPPPAPPEVKRPVKDDDFMSLAETTNRQPVPPRGLLTTPAAAALPPRGPAAVVGRVGELAGVRTLIGHAARGHLSAGLFIAPHGFGKTSMFDVIEAIAGLEGHLVLRASGHPLGGQLWRTALTALADALWQDADEEVPRGDERFEILLQLGLTAKELAGLVGLFSNRDPEIEPAVLDRVLRGFLHSSDDESLCLLIDDAHWLTPTERRQLSQLASLLGHTRISIIAAAAEDHPALMPGVNRIALGSLNDREMGQVLDLLLGGELPAALPPQIVARAKGNPGFARCIVHQLVSCGALSRLDTGWVSRGLVVDVAPDLSSHLRAAVLGLSPEARVFISAGLREGQRFSIATAGSAASLPASTHASVADECVSAGLVLPVPSTPGELEVVEGAVLTVVLAG